ncbi:MAG: hypothetical protein AAGG75_08940 [Bacteroidota bacterium]
MKLLLSSNACVPQDGTLTKLAECNSLRKLSHLEQRALKGGGKTKTSHTIGTEDVIDG